MKRIKTILLISTLALFAACSSNDFEAQEIGGDLIDQPTSVFMVDTFTVETSMIKLDSVTTSGFSKLLLGKYNDPYFGTVRSDIYGKVDFARLALRKINEERVFIEYDSLVLIMYHEPNKLRYIGDTLREQTISVHRITEKFELPKDKSSYKSHDALAHDAEVLGTKTFIPRMGLNSTIDETVDKDPYAKRGGVRIRLDDALGLDIVSKVNSLDDDVNGILKEEHKWLDYFRGLVLKAGDDNSAIFSFQTGNGMKMRLYYHDKKYDQAGVARFHDFPVNQSLSFTNHTVDFVSDEFPFIEKINEIESYKDEVSSKETNNLSFVQGGSGLMTKLKIPSLEVLNKVGSAGGVLKAELIFKPERGSYDKEIYPLPSSVFQLYRTNKTNLFDPFSDPLANSMYVNKFNHVDESYYFFDITSYVDNVLLYGQDYDNALLITLPYSSLGNSFERLVIDNNKKSSDRIRLRVTYVMKQ